MLERYLFQYPSFQFSVANLKNFAKALHIISNRNEPDFNKIFLIFYFSRGSQQSCHAIQTIRYHLQKSLKFLPEPVQYPFHYAQIPTSELSCLSPLLIKLNSQTCSGSWRSISLHSNSQKTPSPFIPALTSLFRKLFRKIVNKKHFSTISKLTTSFPLLNIHSAMFEISARLSPTLATNRSSPPHQFRTLYHILQF